MDLPKACLIYEVRMFIAGFFFFLNLCAIFNKSSVAICDKDKKYIANHLKSEINGFILMVESCFGIQV